MYTEALDCLMLLTAKLSQMEQRGLNPDFHMRSEHSTSELQPHYEICKLKWKIITGNFVVVIVYSKAIFRHCPSQDGRAVQGAAFRSQSGSPGVGSNPTSDNITLPALRSYLIIVDVIVS